MPDNYLQVKVRIGFVPMTGSAFMVKSAKCRASVIGTREWIELDPRQGYNFLHLYPEPQVVVFTFRDTSHTKIDTSSRPEAFVEVDIRLRDGARYHERRKVELGRIVTAQIKGLALLHEMAQWQDKD